MKRMPNGNTTCELLYIATLTYGGFMTFCANLMLKHGIVQIPLYKVSNQIGSKLRIFGYNIYYQNLAPEALSCLKHPFILAFYRSNPYDILRHLKDKSDTTIVIHGPEELRGNEHKKLLNYLRQWKVITIRPTVQRYLKENYDVDSTFMYHPFYEYPKHQITKKFGAVSISRIDFDKYTHVILEANKLLPRDKAVQLYGASNRIYVHHKLGGRDNLKPYYKGPFDRSFQAVSRILTPAKFMVDFSAIRNDGGGTQYTFLEAIYHGCVLVLNRKWTDVKGSDFRHGYNCLAVEGAEDLARVLIDTTEEEAEKITANATQLLKRHIDVDWSPFLWPML